MPSCFHLTTSEMWYWSGGRGILTELSVCYSIMYHYSSMTSSYRSVSCVGLWSCWIQLSVFRALLYHRSSCWYIDLNFLLHSLLYLLVSWAWWDWPLTWLTNHCVSVLWQCWFGHLTRKIVPKVTYNVSSETLNPAVLCYNCWCMLSYRSASLLVLHFCVPWIPS